MNTAVNTAVNTEATETKRILIVEDERVVARDIQATLRRLGYDVPTTAASADAALQKAEELRPHLVMHDINIQGERDGIESALLLRERFDIPVIFLTAYSDDETLDRAKKALPYGFLLKPFEERELVAAIETALYKHEMEHCLQESERRLSTTLRSIGDGVIAADQNGRITLINPIAAALTGWSEQEAIGRELSEVLRLNQDAVDSDADSALGQTLHGQLTGEVRQHTILRTRDGAERFLDYNTSSMRNERGQVTGTVTAFRDMTERRALEDRLVHQALHDPLTSLPNRALFTNRLTHAQARALRSDGAVCIAVLFVDLDNFKIVNDSLGHAAGDALLVEIAARLRRCLRAGDTVARFGGDEFTVLLESQGSPEYALMVADRILSALQEPYLVSGETIYTSPSIGIAFSRTQKELPDELLRNADAAMYEAKKMGKACYEIFRDSLSEGVQQRLELGNQLRQAVERNELVLHYQPKIDLTNGCIYGVEALVRWQHPTKGLIAPSDFIPIAEEMGLIVPIGRWVLNEACRQASFWQKEFPQIPQLAMSVNISARQIQNARRQQGVFDWDDFQINVNLSVRQLQSPALMHDVTEALRETGLEPRHLVLEITESVLMEETEASLKVLQELKDLGVRLAIDDFGTGYSSLAYLKEFPLDFLKIDRKFVTNLQATDNSVILNSIINLAHGLALQVVAEGAETEDDAERLHVMGCDLAQGYYFARPMPAQEFAAYLNGAPLVPALPAEAVAAG